MSMLDTTQPMYLRGCSKCGGTLLKGSDQYGTYLSCFQCGYLREISEPVPNPEIAKRRPKHG